MLQMIVLKISEFCFAAIHFFPGLMFTRAAEWSDKIGLALMENFWPYVYICNKRSSLLKSA
jgi:hypothetical protein